MRDVLIVSKFTATQMFKTKAFKVTLTILLLAIVIGFNIPNIMNLIKGESEKDSDASPTDIILVMDKDDIYKGNLEALNYMEAGYTFEIINDVKDNKELKELIESKDIEAAINITEDEDGVKLDYITDSIGLTGYVAVDSLIFTELYKVTKLTELGISEEEISKINKPLIFDITELTDGKSGSILGLAMGLCMILFFAVYYSAYQVAASITVEKTSKIIDTLITSASPKTIVVGKTLGIGAVGLVQVLAVTLTTFVSYKLFLPADMLPGMIDMSGITIGFVIVSILYFMLGYTLYAFIYALTGSLVSKPEDVQQSGGLISIVALIGFYLAYFSMMNPASSLNKIATFVPISSPFSVPARFITGGVSSLDLFISIIILIISIIIIAYIAIKIYSSAILNYGTKFNIKTMIKMFKQNE